MRSRLDGATIAVFVCIFIFLALPACKRKDSSDNQQKNAAAPAAPAASGADNGGAQTGAAAQPAAGAAGAATATTGAATAASAPTAQPPVVVAAGTKLTVKLSDDLGSATSQTGQSFSGSLDRDVVVDGQTAIPAGANVSGIVVSAHTFGKYAGEANLTLKLTSVNINNTDQNIVTVPRSFGKLIKAKGKVHKFIGGLVKRATGDEKEVTLSADSTYTFTLRKPLTIQ